MRKKQTQTPQQAAYRAVMICGARAYRGYMILRNPITGDVWVEKGGHVICRPNTVEQAIADVDALASPSQEVEG